MKISQKFNSMLRVAIGYLPIKLRLYVRANLDFLQGYVDAEVLYLPELLPPERRRVALDIGANQGVMTYFLARTFHSVHAFEANPKLTRELYSQVPANVQVWSVAVSSENETKVLMVPVVDGVRLHGWGSIEKPIELNGQKIECTAVSAVTIDSLSLNNVDFMKIDVERHELEVLKGAVQTIARCKPWISVEVWQGGRNDIDIFMNHQGYRHTALLELTGHPGTGANMVFIPCGDDLYSKAAKNKIEN